MSQSPKTLEFLQKLKDSGNWNDEYDYSKVNFINTNANLIGINSAKIVADDVEGVSYSIKTNYLLNLIDVLPKSITLPNDKSLSASPLTEQIKELSKYTVLIKVK